MCRRFAGTMIAVSCFFGASSLIAQSTFELTPPMQMETLNNSPIPMLAESFVPAFRFAIAESDGKQITLVKSTPTAVNAEIAGAKTFVEMVTQTFEVGVPYTEEVDGKKVTKVRMEKRTREIPVTRVIAPDVDKDDLVQVQQTYTVSIPFREMVDGKPVTRVRHDQRTRTVLVNKNSKAEVVPDIVSDTYELDDVKCFGIDGKSLTSDDVERRLAERKPVILINSEKQIEPYFEHLLQPEIVFVVQPKAVPIKSEKSAEGNK